jgi:hypothetical protein
MGLELFPLLLCLQHLGNRVIQQLLKWRRRLKGRWKAERNPKTGFFYPTFYSDPASILRALQIFCHLTLTWPSVQYVWKLAPYYLGGTRLWESEFILRSEQCGGWVRIRLHKVSRSQIESWIRMETEITVRSVNTIGHRLDRRHVCQIKDI